jgi:twitching motility protein PilT
MSQTQFRIATAPGAGGTATSLARDAAVLDQARTRVLLDELLGIALERGASDLHLSAGAPPTIRVRGHMEPVEGYDLLHADSIQRAIFSVLPSHQRDRFEGTHELDTSYTLPGKARFRVNVMRQRGAVSGVFRVVPWEIKSLAELGMPERVANFAGLPRGLVLVTGPTGSGKSTTVASLVDIANSSRAGHIVTIEDPIEFLFDHKRCIVNQREVGEDTESFAAALRHVLRQDPDIVLVGEMRDPETISVALTAAETGHLVFATLHTRSAQEAVTRIVDSYPATQQATIRAQLASALQGVVAQTLVRTSDGAARVPAAEILVATPAVRNLIRENKIAHIAQAIESGAQYGMETLDQSLARLVLTGRVTPDAAREVAHDRQELDKLIAGGRGRVSAPAYGARFSDFDAI